LAALCSGCLYFPAARQLAASSSGTAVPWFCTGTPNLTVSQCDVFALQIDLAYLAAAAYPTVGDAVATGETTVNVPDGMGTAYFLPGTTVSTFAPAAPQLALYNGSDDDARLAGVAHLLHSDAKPGGYPGPRDDDSWIEAEPGVWLLPLWIIRGYENQGNVFAPGHPCLAPSVNLASTEDECFTETHTEPFEILVTNDDGIAAPGVDAVVEKLRTLPNVTITLVAPATNQSGKGDSKTPGGAPGSPGATASGFAGTAVAGTPADSVIYAINVQKVTPDLVVSGSNYGANMGPFIPVSGTVGAARTAARLGIPAVAVSTGIGPTVPLTDFASSADAAAAWVEEFRLGLVGPPQTEVANINTPTCTTGSIRGVLDTSVALAFDGRGYNTQNCTSSVTVINDDIDAMNHGFISRTDAKKN